MEDRQEVNKGLEVRDSGFFALRTPLLPIEELVAWSRSFNACAVLDTSGDQTAHRNAWNADVQMGRERLRELIGRPEILQALFVASPALEASLKYWIRDPESKKGLQAERSLVRYFVRMCGRSTPFGIFSGCSVGRITPTDRQGVTELSLAPRAQYRTTSRLDFDYLFALTAQLRSEPGIADELRYWSNSSLRRIGNVWHYVESRVAHGNRGHYLVKLYNDDTLEAVLKRAASGAKVSELTDVARRQPDGVPEISEEEARGFIHELIQSEVLVSNLAPPVTGQPPLDDIIEKIAEAPSGGKSASQLAEVKARLAEMDDKGLGISPDDYRSLADSLRSFPAEFDIARLFQVDMVKPVEDACLSASVVNELVNAIGILCRVGISGERGDLRTFRDAFVSRYDHAWVPLLQVLDEESGIGFGTSSAAETSALLRGIQIPGRPDRIESVPVDLAALLRSKISVAPDGGVHEVVLDLSDLPAGIPAAQCLPEAFDLAVTLAAGSTEALRQGDFQVYVRGVSGPSGARLLGRFCHADPDLNTHVRRHLREEEAQDPEAVYAEIVHLPEGRIGNVLCRPVLRDYEITYLGRSGADSDRQLPVSDLMVSVSADQNIILYSQRLQKRVIPRLSNAHGYMNPKLSSIYRFLCSLQHQGTSGSAIFSWGSLESQKTLPRVRIGRVVLACARWKLDADEVKALAGEDRYQTFAAVQKLRQARGLPRWILLAESDNTLPVDLDNPLSVDAFTHLLKRAESATLREMYPAPQDLCVTGPEGHFQHELVVPFVRQRSTANPERRPHSTAGATTYVDPVVRSLPPGSDWLYVKLYGGPAALDDVLSSSVPRLLRAARESGTLSSWFFIRYADPHQHLRLRLQTSTEAGRGSLLSLVSGSFNPVLAEGRIWKIQFDTYQREIERYGGVEGLLAAEQIFSADSEAVLRVLEMLDGDAGLDLRWQIALLGVDRILSDFGFDLANRVAFSKRLRDGYAAEMQVGSEAKRQLGDRYRAERKKLEALFDNSARPSAMIETAKRILDHRSHAMTEPVRKLHAFDDTGVLQASMDSLVGSFVHMHVNRMISSSQRAHELVLYDFLHRIYDGKLARAGRSVPSERGSQEVEVGACV